MKVSETVMKVSESDTTSSRAASAVWVRAAFVVAAVWVLAGCQDPDAVTYVVDSLADAPAVSPGDGVCESTVGGCTLRAAVQEANASPHADTIRIGDGHTYVLSVVGSGEDEAATGDLDILEAVVVTGSSTVDAGGVDRVFDVHGGRLTLNEVTVTGGSAFGGGGIRVGSGAALLGLAVEVRDNQGAPTAGGIHAAADSSVHLVASSVTHNSGGTAGGVRTQGSLGLFATTVSGNVAAHESVGAGGVQVAGPVPATVRWSTVTANAGATGGVAGPATLTATVVGAQASGADCAQVVSSVGFSADSDGTCLDGTGPQDLVGVDPLLGPLGSHGGLTRNHVVLSGSPLIDVVGDGDIDCGTGGGSIDQRGEPRPVDGDGDGTAACDVGAVERQPGDLAGGVLVVNHGGDDVAADPSSGVCQDVSGPPGACSLRAAVDVVNADPAVEVVVVDSLVDTIMLSREGTLEDANATGDLDVHADLLIDGQGVTVDGAGLDRVLHVHAGVMELRRLTITGGHAVTGGGVRVEEGAVLTVVESTVDANTATAGFWCEWPDIAPEFGTCGGEGGGGGIWSVGTLHLQRSTVSRNQTVGGGCTTEPGGTSHTVVCTWAEGGGVYASSGTVHASTIADNAVGSGLGSGLVRKPGGPSLEVRASSIAHNNVPVFDMLDQPGGQIRGSVVISGTVIAGEGPLCVDAALQSHGYNLAEDGSCGLGHVGDMSGSLSFLEQLGAFGGPTETAPPLGYSPLVEAIPPGTTGLCDGSTPTDQRGEPRPAGVGCDIGAVELEGGAAPPVLELLVNHAGDDVAADPASGVCQDASGPPGACALRAAIDVANASPGHVVVEIAPGVHPVLDRPGTDDANASGDLDVLAPLTLRAGGAVIDAGGVDRILHVHGVVVTIEHAVLTGGAAPTGGALRQDGGHLRLVASTVTANSAATDGGGLYLGLGGTDVVTSTLSGNGAGDRGGAVFQESGRLDLRAVTVVDNSAPAAGAVHRAGGVIALGASVVSGAGPVCGGSMVSTESSGHNLISDTSCGPLSESDLLGLPPLLGPLADNGGPTPSHLPALNSPLVDAIPPGTPGCDGTIPTDQRGETRPTGSGCDIGAVEGADAAPQAPVVLVVNHAGDDVAADPASGVCQDASGPPGACSLRAAIDIANASGTLDEIQIAPGVQPVLSRAGAGEDANQTGDLDIVGHMTIDGGGASVDADGLDRVFDVHTGRLELRDVALTGGTVTDGDGGGVRVGAAMVVLDRVTVAGNSTSGHGGGILQTGGVLDILESTVEDNTATGSGGGLHRSAPLGATRVLASTVTGNHAGGGGGGLHLTGGGSTDLENATVSGNSTPSVGGGAMVTGGSVALTHVTLAGNTAGSGGLALHSTGTPVTVTASAITSPGPSCSGAVVSGGHNAVADSSCGFASGGDLEGTVLALGPLDDHGGPTQTHLPALGSPVVDRIPVGSPGLCDGTVSQDQRGEPRPDGPACDAGAVEGAGDESIGVLELLVTHSGDDVAAEPASGVCQDESGSTGACALRAAIDVSNAWPGETVITIEEGVHPVLARPGAGEDGNATGDLDVTSPLTVQGSGAVIDGAGLDRVFDVRATTLVLEGVTVTGGSISGSLASGGGVRVVEGALTVRDSSVVANTATYGGGVNGLNSVVTLERAIIADNSGSVGGGVRLVSSRAHIDRSTIANNSANEGGGLFASGSTATPTFITNSTVSTNAASLRGGAIFWNSSDPFFASYTTMANNSAPTGAGVWATGGSVVLVATVLGNAGPECWYPVQSSGFNVVADDTCGLTESTDQQDVNPLLAGLADNGGPTPTHLPFAGSPVIDAVALGSEVLCDNSDYPTDQRGQARPVGAGCDVGAVEGSSAISPEPLALEVTHPGDDVAADPASGVCQDSSGPPGACSLRAAIDVANAWPLATTITIADGVHPTLSRVGAGEDLNRTGDLDVVGDLTIVGGGAIIDGSGLDRVLQLHRATVDLEDLTITGGSMTSSTSSADGGGGITQRAGGLTLTDVTLHHNTSTAWGGGLSISAGGTAVITGGAIHDNQAAHGGGISLSGSTAVVETTEIRENVAAGQGGGVRTTGAGDLHIAGSTIAGNGAADGGGLHLAGAATIEASTVAHNHAAHTGGGVVRTVGDVTARNSTISDNRADVRGGGVAGTSSGGLLALRSTTVVGNVAPSGSAIFRNVGTVSLAGSLIGGWGDDCQGSVSSAGFNIGSDGSCGLTQPTDVAEARLLVAPLADNGGPTRTRLPYADSPAVDAIPVGTPELCDGTLTVDQRGVTRPEGSGCDVGAVEGASATSAEPLTLVVNHGGDDVAADPQSGVCQDASGPPGACSLRAAIDVANASPMPETITIDVGVHPAMSRSGADEDFNHTGDLDVRDDLTIIGGGAIVDAAGLDRVFDVRQASLVLDGVTVTGGVAQQGAGVHATGAMLTLSASQVLDNHASGLGGGIYSSGSTTTVSASTIAGNTASTGAGVYRTSGGELALTTSTVSGNTASVRAGGVYSSGTTTIVSSTVYANQAPEVAAVFRNTGSVTVGGSILAGPGTSCGGNPGASISSGGFNLSSDASCTLTQPSDQPGVLALLGPLTDNGGPTLTHLPFANSPALDVVPPGTPDLCDGTTPPDQRGVTRPEGSGCDIGSVEGASATAVTPLTLVVNHDGDDVAADPTSGVCQDASGPPGACSLRAAVDVANASPTADTITIGGGVDPVLSRAGVGEDGNQTGDLDVYGVLTVEGGGATIDAAGVDRVFHLHGATVQMTDLAITGGSGSGGAGAYLNGGSLTLEGVEVSGNQSAGAGGGLAVVDGALSAHEVTVAGNAAGQSGGGIALLAGSTAEIGASTVAQNTAAGDGGGLHASGAIATVERSTISGNAAQRGGGISTANFASLTVENSTISANQAYDTAGAAYGAADLDLRLSTVANNTSDIVPGVRRVDGVLTLAGTVLLHSGSDCFGTITSGGHNISSDSTCGLSGVGDQGATLPLLGPLADNGGATSTHLPYANSPVLDVIPVGTVGLCDGSVATDQRGESRPGGVGCDAGSVERQPTDP
jgi:CSLREA domain-containing protein